MPIYEYECNACGKGFEKLMMQGDSEEGTECPRCRSVNVKKLMSAGTCLGGKGLGACAPGGPGRFS
ncbi:MAG: FmdB family zinc ribbon protein [Thermodesulfobacteriota bacterium]